MDMTRLYVLPRTRRTPFPRWAELRPLVQAVSRQPREQIPSPREAVGRVARCGAPSRVGGREAPSGKRPPTPTPSPPRVCAGGGEPRRFDCGAVLTRCAVPPPLG